ncbi:MAG: aminotransferase class I/II-fold pyridoxal phosphate-dependent enzyme [Pseudomonadota bacterium]
MYANRVDRIKPFEVMQVMARAFELEGQGHDVVHLEVGEPDFATAEPIVAAGQAALAAGATKYTNAVGIDALREKIAAYYAALGVDVTAERILVTAGASGGLTLLNALFLNPGDELLITDPGYPCNDVFAQLVGATPSAIAVNENEGFVPTIGHLEAHWSARTRGVLFASPANPTGTMFTPAQLRELTAFVRAREGFFILDEIYQGITWDAPYQTGLSLVDDLYVLNSFSKFFGMTGWRLGWLVVPEEAVEPITKLAQNLFICPSTPAQMAAMAAFDAPAMAIHEERAAEFARRYRVLSEGLIAMGFRIPVTPAGAFYVYVDVSHTGMVAKEFCWRLLDEFYVATTPGDDFGTQDKDRFVRFAYTNSISAIETALGRVRAALQAWQISS